MPRAVGGNYADLLEDDKYVTGKTIKDARWRVNNNLLGESGFCPVVRRTKELNDLLSQNIRDKIKDLKESYPQDIFSRAIIYLYKKETNLLTKSKKNNRLRIEWKNLLRCF